MTTRSRRGIIIVALLAGAVVALNLLAQGLDRAVGGNEPSGEGGSSYATSADGVAAYASLLRHYGHEVSVARGDLADNTLPADSTIVILEPGVLTRDDAAKLLDAVGLGARLVIGGRTPFYLRNLRDRPPKWSANGQPRWTEINPELRGIRQIDAAATGSWSDPGSGEVLVGDAQHALLTRDHLGTASPSGSATGQFLFLADPSPIENAFIGAADNAAFALWLAGDDSRPVVFVEGVHGFGETRGFAAIPTRWKIALALLGVAVLAFVWSRARRFGPPDRAARDLPPARAEYVRALSVTLERTRDRAGALASLQQWARDRVTARAALRPDATDEELTRAARTLGYDDDEIRALLAPPTTDQDAMALGRAAARADGRDGRAT